MAHDELRARFPDARDWTVSRFRHDRRHVVVRFHESESLTAWVFRLRCSCPSLGDRRSSDLLAEARRTSLIDLGIMQAAIAYSLIQLLTLKHFDVRAEDVSFVSYLPKVAGSGLIIEDSVEAEGFCLSLILAGATVQEIEN